MSYAEVAALCDMLNALVLELDAGDADRLSDELLAAGALSVTYEDALTGTAAESFRFDDPGEIASWPPLRLTVLLRAQDDCKELLQRACGATGVAMPAYESYVITEENWVVKAKEQFAPIQVSERLWVVPTWHVPPAPGAINLVLDPGLAFGTGSHPSTRLCLQWLERRISGGETVLDYGCGSGILAIAALKLGARSAIGVDIDPEAVASARANALRNSVLAEFSDGGDPVSVTADLVVANILANPLRVLAPLLASHCAPGGWLALAGLLSSQAADVEKHYARWFRFEECTEAEGWVCLAGVRR